jgi:hypothetical protein
MVFHRAWVFTDMGFDRVDCTLLYLSQIGPNECGIESRVEAPPLRSNPALDDDRATHIEVLDRR